MQDDFFASSFHLNYHTRNAIVVRPGTDLAVVYNWIKSAQRDGAMGALAADNWRCILLTPGVHTVAATLILDTDYIAIVGMGGSREGTRIEGDFADAIVEQAANIVALRGFTIYQANHGTGDPGTDASIGFLVNVSAGDNEGSVYHSMHFGSDWYSDGAGVAAPVYCNTVEKGTWWFCEASDGSWRVPSGGTFSPTMYFCKAENYSYGGDGRANGIGSIGGTYYNCEGGDQCWGGCMNYGLDILDSAKFYDCIAGDKSYAMGKDCAGTFYNCIGGDACFGGWDGASVNYGTFSGKAYNCHANGQSFGSGHSAGCRNTGTMVNCEAIGMLNPIYAVGAEIRKCRLVVTVNNKDGIILKDSATVVYDTDIIVYQGGTGIPINDDGGARNVVAAHNRFNNQSNDADGLGPNVTNLIGAAYNVVDDQIV